MSLLPPINLPIENKWPQLNQGDHNGIIQASRNIDLDDPGVIRLAQRTRYIGQVTANLVNVLAIVFGNFFTASALKYFFISSSKIYYSPPDLSSFTQDTLANTPTLSDVSDGTTWQDATGIQVLYVSKTLRVDKLTNGVWTTNWSDTDFAGAGNFHFLEPNATNANLLATDGYLIKKIDSAGAVTTAITLPNNLIARWIVRGNNVNYIGCESSYGGGRGAIVVWDGLSTTTGANSIIYTDTPNPMSGCLDEDGILNVITADGRLMRFNGSSLSYLAELPPFRDYKLRFGWGGSLTAGRGVLPRGMTLIRGRIHIQLDASMISTDAELINPQFQSGTWVYDKTSNAFYHKAAPSNSNTITDFGQSHGSAMVSAISPVFVDYNMFGFSAEPAAAVGGSFITGGSLYPNTVAGTVLRTVVSQTTGLNRGSFSTVKIDSQGMADNKLAVWCKYQNVSTSDDKIIFKYRTDKRDPFTITNSVATWVTNLSFTSTDTKIADAEVGDEITVLTGNGAGCTAHITAISLVTGTYTVTLDEAITNIAANDTAYIMFDSWIKLPTQITFTDTDGYKRIPINNGGSPKWIEIKVEMRGEGGKVAVEELSLISSPKIPKN